MKWTAFHTKVAFLTLWHKLTLHSVVACMIPEQLSMLERLAEVMGTYAGKAEQKVSETGRLEDAKWAEETTFDRQKRLVIGSP
jgi:hypothetical protein